nr:uncharacterized protein LOC117992734 [Maniola hyperantus]
MASQTNREWLEEFIELYRSEPCLWNTKGKEYHNRELKRSAYTKLIEKLKIIDPSADKDAVVKKINNIRSTYKKERKKIADSKKSGAGTQEVYKPKLWYYSMLLFLDDQVEPRHSCSNMESTDNESQFGWTCARVMASQTNREWLEEFIELYRSEPCLWNTKGKEYHNRELKRSAYTKLIEKLKIIDPSADKDAVVKKINNIRSTYKKERKKIADSKKSGAGTQEVYKPKLWYYAMLLFLDDQVEPRHSCSNMESTDNECIISLGY